MAKRKNIQTRWAIEPTVHQKVAVYKTLHNLDSLQIAANILLEKATIDIKLPK